MGIVLIEPYSVWLLCSTGISRKDEEQIFKSSIHEPSTSDNDQCANTVVLQFSLVEMGSTTYTPLRNSVTAAGKLTCSLVVLEAPQVWYSSAQIL